MTVLEVLENASEYLDLRQDLDYYFNENNNTLPSSELQNKFSVLLKALNLIVEEIATEFKPVYLEEVVNFEEGRVSLENLNEDVYKVISVFDKNNAYKFRVIDGNIICNVSGGKTVKYACVPSSLTASDDITCFSDQIPSKTLSFGVVMEYLYLSGILDEVTPWEDRFYKSLKNVLRNIGRINMPKKRWE